MSLKKFLIGVGIIFTLFTLFILALLLSRETNYYNVGSYTPIAYYGYTVTKTESELTKIEIPNYFPENNQCIDFWFTSFQGNHVLTVNDFTMTVTNKVGSEKKIINAHLFWYDGSETGNGATVKNYVLEKTKQLEKNKYVFFRKVVDLTKEDTFYIHVKANYVLDSVPRKIDTTFCLEKRRKWVLHSFRVH